MRPSTRSAGKPKTPTRTPEKMTRTVTLSSARPRKPLTSPAASQRGARVVLAGAGVGRPTGAEQRLHLAPRALRERIAPGQRAAVVGDVLVVELDRLAHALTHVDPRAIGPPVQRVVLVEDDLRPRMLALGVGGQEVLEPARDFLVRAAGKHARDCSTGRRMVAPAGACFYRRGRGRRRLRLRAARATLIRRNRSLSTRCTRRRGTSCTPPRRRTWPGRTPCRGHRCGDSRPPWPSPALPRRA